jgi:hypothetical protein
MGACTLVRPELPKVSIPSAPDAQKNCENWNQPRKAVAPTARLFAPPQDGAVPSDANCVVTHGKLFLTRTPDQSTIEFEPNPGKWLSIYWLAL